jgi:hypothetical protein
MHSLLFPSSRKSLGSGRNYPGTTKLYDRRGYNPGKSARFLCDVLMSPDFLQFRSMFHAYNL